MMIRFAAALVAGAVVGSVGANAQSCSNNFCQPVWGGQPPRTFTYGVSFKPDISPALDDRGKNSTRSHAAWARDKWNDQFIARRQSIRINYLEGTTPPADGVKVFVTDADTMAH